jgi:prepilin-type N-terminal cleavage/methylation domain-containing protein
MKTRLLKIKDIKASSDKGFTLIELLVVIGILAILMGIVLIAINPAHQFSLANDTNRRNATAQILSAVGQYEAENKGTLPAGLSAGMAEKHIADTASGGVDLCAVLVAGATQYIPALPVDPSKNTADIAAPCPATYDTGYTVSVDAGGRVTILAPSTEVGAEIKVTR